jgi:hemolysin activation/secretion protein
VFAALGAVSALAQTPPDAGRILQETRPAERPPTITTPPIQAPSQQRPAAPAVGEEVRVKVTQFVFRGNSAISSAALNAVLAPWVGRALNFGELIEAVEAIEVHYKSKGYFLIQASLPPQRIRDGAIEIAISEGQLGQARLEGESRVKADVLYRYLDRLPKGKALTLPLLERQILLINELAGSSAKLDLQAGETLGSTDVVLAQQVDDLVTGRLELNNHGFPSTGENRLGLTLNANSLFHLGERITFNALGSAGGGLLTYSLRGDVPLGGDGWRVMATASRATYSLGGDFKSLDASGTADSVRVGAAYPFIRSRVTNLKLQIETDKSQLVDHFGASGTDLDKRSQGLTATLSGDWLDQAMGGGANRAELVARTGRLDLGPTSASLDAPPTGPGTAGQFSKFMLSASRQQMLSSQLILQLQLSWQAAGKNLDSSEKISLGGPNSMPGYGGGEAVADSGTLLKMGLRWQAMPQLALTAFADYARYELAHEPVPTATRNERSLADYGLSAEWQISKAVSAIAIVARPVKEPVNPADKDKPRFWGSLAYAW